MNKIWLVAKREYLHNLKRPAFLFAVFGAPILTFVVWFVIFALISNDETNLDQVGKIGYVDQAGILANPIVPDDSADLFVSYPDDASARADLEARTIGAYFVLPENYLVRGTVEFYGLDNIPDAAKDAVDEFLLANLGRLLDRSVPLERIQNPVDMTVQVQDSGRNLTEASLPVLILLPLIFVLIFTMSSNVTSSFLMNGIVEERTTRIIEILVTSLTPTQLLLGKVLGLGALGLTQIVVWLGAGMLLMRFGQALPFLAGVVLPLDMLVLFILYFLLSYFLLATLMAGIGAIAGSEQESRQYAGIFGIVFAIPFFFVVQFIEDPNGNVPLILSMIPVTSPMSMLLRVGFGAVPFWQILLSLGILLVTALLISVASARIFRWSLLLYGKRFSLRELWRVARSAPTPEVSAARAAQQGVSS